MKAAAQASLRLQPLTPGKRNRQYVSMTQSLRYPRALLEYSDQLLHQSQLCTAASLKVLCSSSLPWAFYLQLVPSPALRYLPSQFCLWIQQLPSGFCLSVMMMMKQHAAKIDIYSDLAADCPAYYLELQLLKLCMRSF